MKGHSLVQRIVHHCVTSCRFEGSPFQSPFPPPFASYQSEGENPVFYFIGVDFASPQTEGLSKTDMAWICLSTCLVTKVHLDIVLDMSIYSDVYTIYCCSKGITTKIHL